VETLEVGSDVGVVALGGNLLINLLLSSALNQLWSLVNTQQIIVLTPLFLIQLPGNASVFFKELMRIAAFDIIELNDQLDWFFGLEPTEPINSNFEAIGFESVYLLHNLGTLLIAYFFYPFMCLVQKLCAYLGRWSKRCREWSDALKRRLYYGSLIRLIFEGYSLTTLCCIINIMHRSWEDPSRVFMTLIAFFFLALVILFPTVFAWYLKSNYIRLQSDHYELKYGDFYVDLALN